jgi:hypothetical protein
MDEHLFAQNETLLNFQVILFAGDLVVGSVSIPINADELFDEFCAVGTHVDV